MAKSTEVAIIEIASTPIVIKADFEGEKIKLTEMLSKYDGYVVTEETLAEDKALGKEVKAKAKIYDDKRKELAKEMSAPVVEFNSNMNELKTLCLSSASLINDQVAVFETAKVKLIQIKINEFVAKLRTELGVTEEFENDSLIEDIARLTSVTATGKLNKPTITKVTGFVNDELQGQKHIEMRLVMLENESFKSGLKSPLVRANVEAFLFDADDEYSLKLTALIQSELVRQKQITEQVRAETETTVREEIAKEDVIKSDTAENTAENIAGCVRERLGKIFADTPNEPITQLHSQEVTPVVEESNSSPFTVVARFAVNAPTNISPDQISQKIESMLKQIGVDSLQSIEVIKNVDINF